MRTGSRFRNPVYSVRLGTFLLASLVGLALLLSYRTAYQLTHPRRQPVTASPGSLGLQYEAVELRTRDGHLLSGWFIPGSNAAAVVLIHGLGDNRQGMLSDASMLYRHGYSTLLFDLRAHGESEGAVTTLGYEEVQDVAAAVEDLQDKRGVAPGRIGLLGRSLGGAVAIMAGASIRAVGGVVAEGSFSCARALEQRYFHHFTRLPAFLAPLVVLLGEWQTGVSIDAVSPVVAARKLAPRPLLLMHGSEDQLLPPANSIEIYEAAGEPKSLWLVPRAGHVAVQVVEPQEYEKRVIEFFDTALLGRR